MWSVSTTSVLPSKRPREKPNSVCSAGACAFGFMWIVRTVSYSSSRMHDRVAVAHELHRQRRDHDQRRAFRAATQQRVVARVPLREPGAPGRRQRIAALEHRKRGGVAHDRGPDAENAVGLRRRLSDVGFDRRAADDAAALAFGEVRLRAAERELVAATTAACCARGSRCGRARSAHPRSSRGRRRRRRSARRRDCASRRSTPSRHPTPSCVPSAFVAVSRIWPCGLRQEIVLMTPVTSIVLPRIEDAGLAVMRGGDLRPCRDADTGERR